MHSSYLSQGPSAPDPVSAIAATLAVARTAAVETQDPRASSRILREIDRIIRALPPPEQPRVAVRACELLLAETTTRGIVKVLNRLGQNYGVSPGSSPEIRDLGGKRLAEAISRGPIGWVSVLQRFSAPLDPSNPDIQKLVRERFVGEVRAGRAQDALHLRRQFPEVMAVLSRDPRFVIAELRLIPQLARATDVGIVLPRFTQELFPLPPKLTQGYMHTLLATYKNSVKEFNWNGAMAVLRCAAPDDSSPEIKTHQRAEFFEQLRLVTLQAINSTVDGELTLEQVIKSQSQSTKLRDLAREVISEDLREEPDLLDRLRAASRRIICEHTRSAAGVADTITVIANLADAFSLFETQPEELPNGGRIKRWVAGRLGEAGESLWYLAEFGNRAELGPCNSSIESYTYDDFIRVKDLASRTFKLQSSSIPDSRSVKHWRFRFELRKAHAHLSGKEKQRDSGGIVDAFIDKLRIVELYNRIDRMLLRGQHEHALPLAQELLRITLSNPNCRDWLGIGRMERLPRMFASACGSPEHAKGMLSQILLHQIRRGGADLELLGGVSNELASLYRLHGQTTRADAAQRLSRDILIKDRSLSEIESSIRQAGLGRRWRGVRR